MEGINRGYERQQTPTQYIKLKNFLYMTILLHNQPFMSSKLRAIQRIPPIHLKLLYEHISIQQSTL